MSTLEFTSPDENIICASKWFILTQRMQNLEIVNLKCVTYAQLTPLPSKHNDINEIKILHLYML